MTSETGQKSKSRVVTFRIDHLPSVLLRNRLDSIIEDLFDGDQDNLYAALEARLQNSSADAYIKGRYLNDLHERSRALADFLSGQSNTISSEGITDIENACHEIARDVRRDFLIKGVLPKYQTKKEE